MKLVVYSSNNEIVILNHEKEDELLMEHFDYDTRYIGNFNRMVYDDVIFLKVNSLDNV